MRKIPTVFVRDEDTNRRYVKNEVNPECEWVVEGEGFATRKFDGMCCLVRDGRLFKRREFKVERPAPLGNGLMAIPESLVDAGARVEYEATIARLVKADAESRLAPGTVVVPDDFDPVAYDPETEKLFGWMPVGDGNDDARHREAFELGKAWGAEYLVDGQTYELVGPKVNGNPDGFDHHVLIRHGFTTVSDVPRYFDALHEWMTLTFYEGIVWHHEDGRMAKLKRKDFAR